MKVSAISETKLCNGNVKYWATSLILSVLCLQSRKRHRRSRSANAVVTAHMTVHKDGVDASAEINTDSSRKRIHSSSPAEGRKTLRKCNSADPVNSGE